MDDISYLFTDPRPELHDTQLWDKLLKSIPLLDDSAIAYHLQTNLWTMRSAGVILKRHPKKQFEFSPIIGPGGAYDCREFFDQQCREHLLLYSQEIKELFRKVDGLK